MAYCEVFVERDGKLVHCPTQATLRCGQFRYCEEHRKKLGPHGTPAHSFRRLTKHSGAAQ